MKAKVITYSRTKLNKVVRKYMDLTPLNDSVYYALEAPDPNNPDWDELEIILRTGEVFFSMTYARRKAISDRASVARATQLAEHPLEHIEGIMQRGEFLSLLFIEVAKEFDMDPAPLMEYRNACQRRREEQRQIREQKKHEAREQTHASSQDK